MSPGFFDLFDLFYRRNLIIICFRRFLLKRCFWFPHKIFIFLGAYLCKIEIKIIFKGCMCSHRRRTIKNIQFKLVTIILFEIRYTDFFGSNFSNFVLRIACTIWWWSLKPASKEFVFINVNFEFVFSKSMHKPPLPLKHVLCFMIL